MSSYLPTAVDRLFMQLLDMEFYDFDRFCKEYTTKACAFWSDKGGKFGVVSTYVNTFVEHQFSLTLRESHKYASIFTLHTSASGYILSTTFLDLLVVK